MGFGATVEGFKPGSLTVQTLTGRFKVATVQTPPSVPTQVNPSEEQGGVESAAGERVLAFAVGFLTEGNVTFPTPVRRTFGGFQGETHGAVFFEKMYLLPRTIDTGIVLSDQVFTIDIYSSYKNDDRSWSAYDDSSAGQGVALDSFPPSTVVFGPHSGATRTLTVSLDGPPAINGTLDFTFDVPGLLQIPIVGTRSVLFPFEPEQPISESLEFLTDILVMRSGKEQRRALRKNPRVVYEYEVKTDEADRRLLENLIFNGQDRAFGVPVWFEATSLEADIAISDTTITVGSTAGSDYRAGGLAVVWTDAFTFEALQIASFTSTTITFSSPFLTATSAGARVMPVHSAYMNKTVRQTRHLNNLQTNRLKFRIINNDVDIASTAAFNSYNSRVLLDGPNAVPGSTMNETWNRNIKIIDNGTGSPTQFTDQDVSRHGSSKGFVSTSRSEVQDIRNLLHALKGRATSFYLPTFFADFEAVADVGPTDAVIDVSAVDYVDSVQQRQARNIVRITKTDGTQSDPLLVTGSSKPSVGVERLSVAPLTAGITAVVADIDRIEYIEKVRMNTDRIKIRHFDANGSAIVTFPVMSVLEEDD